MSQKNKRFNYIIVFALLALCCLLSLCFGSVSIPLSEIIRSFTKSKPSTVNELIIRSVRAPRILGAIFAGAGLSVSGVLLQIVMNNSLAAPNIIGVNSGAGLFVLLAMIFYPKHYAFIPFGAFLGAFLAAIFVFFIASRAQMSKIAIVLSGVAVSGFMNAITNALLLFFPNATINISTFMYGSLSGVTMQNITLPCIYISIVLILVSLFKSTLNVLLLGDSLAVSLGLSIKRNRFLLLVASATLAGSVVSYTGLLGFVGLIVPHIARKFIGYDAKHLIPFSIILGALVVVLSDWIGRILFIPYEIPVGIIMSFLGSPYFIYLLIQQKGAHSHVEIR